MKLRWQDNTNYMKKLAGELTAVLIYGPNRGQVDARADAMTKAMLGDSLGDPFRHFIIDNQPSAKNDKDDEDSEQDSKDSKNKPPTLMEEALTPAFGGGKKLIHLKNPPEKTCQSVAELLQEKQDGFFLLITCEELTPASNWRKLFENSKTENGGICACYIADNPGDIIGTKIRDAGIAIDRDALQLLSGQLQGRDNGVINMETEKLILYAGEDKKLSLADVRELCGSGRDADIDSLIISCLAGRSLSRLDSDLDGLYKRGVNEITIVRSLVRNLRRITELKSKLARGEDFKSAAKNLRIFFKLEKDFQQAARLWNDAALYTLILQAQATEAHSKSSYGFESLIVARTLQRITAQAMRLARR